MDMISKLATLMEEKDMNKADLSRCTGIPYTTIDGLFKKGTDNIKRSTITKIATYFNVTIDYLANDDITDKYYNKAVGFQVQYQEMVLVKKLRELDAKSKGAVENLLEYLHAYKNAPQQRVEAEKKLTRSIPYYRVAASAGFGEYLDSPDRETIEIPRITKYDEADFAVRINGDSMEPVFQNGDIALVRQQPSLEYGDIGLFMLNNEGYIKRYERDGLVSLNKKYQMIRINDYDGFKISGKVIAALGRDN